ncbi:MAG TPA: nucleotidyltransferase domain-containing protein [Thermodesulfobacteriota bacterium]|nr:nucleotidyltransferase domain-containing protein [Thermodesulfobacteriota bacterium]
MKTKEKKEIDTLLKKIVDAICNKYAPEKIILFGSYAYGTPTKESDVDFLIIRGTQKPFHKRWAEVCHIISEIRRGTGIAFSPFVVTPEELKERLQMGDQFFEEIISKGKVLYAR